MCVYTNELMRRIFQKMWPELMYLVYVGVSGEGLAIEGVVVGGKQMTSITANHLFWRTVHQSQHSFLFPQLSL